MTINRSPVPARAGKKGIMQLHTAKLREVDRAKRLTDEQKTLFNTQREVIFEYARGKNESAGELDEIPELMETDLDPDSQWNMVDRLENLAQQAGLDEETLQRLLAQKKSQKEQDDELPDFDEEEKLANAPSTTVAAASDERPATAEKTDVGPMEVTQALDTITGPANVLTQDTIVQMKQSLAHLPKDTYDSIIATAQQCVDMAERLHTSEKEAEKKKADLEARARAEKASAHVAAAKTTTSSETKSERVVSMQDYVNSDTDTEREDLDLTNAAQAHRTVNRLDRAETVAKTALRAAREAKGREWVQMLLFLPKGWHPSELQWECLEMDRCGWLNDCGVTGMSEKVTPIRFYLRGESWYTAASEAVYWWNPQYGIRTALDAPSENSMQLSQARDFLRVFIEQEKAVFEEDARRLHLQWPLKRMEHKHSKYNPEGDWWTIYYTSLGDKEHAIMRAEYNHRKMTQCFIFSIDELAKLNWNGRDIKDLICKEITTMYDHSVQFQKTEIPMLVREKKPVVKDEQEELQPPPPKAIAGPTSPSASQKPQSSTFDPWKNSAPKGSSWKGGFKGSGKKGGGKKGAGKKGGKSGKHDSWASWGANSWKGSSWGSKGSKKGKDYDAADDSGARESHKRNRDF